MTEPKKVCGVIEFIKKGSDTLATFVMQESLMNSESEDVNELICSVLNKMNWRAENTPLEIKCYGNVPAWERKIDFCELDGLLKKDKNDKKALGN